MIDSSKERFIEITEEPIGVVSVNNSIVCVGCIFANGSTPFDDTPYKSNCAVYSRESGRNKPNAIYFDGKPCKYRRTH